VERPHEVRPAHRIFGKYYYILSLFISGGLKEVNIMMEKTMGLVKGRHEMPVDDFIFGGLLDPTDIEGLEEIACDRLSELFTDVFVSVTSLPNQANFTNVPVYKRGRLNLYVTEFTAALVAVLNADRCLGIDVTLYHFNFITGDYNTQEVL
jgi:hypothetical protein